VSLTYLLLLLATILVAVAAMAAAYRRSRDPLHPLLIACPIVLFVYVAQPWVLQGDRRTDWFVPMADMERVQAIFVCIFAAFCAGALAASGRARWRAPAEPFRLPPRMSRRLLVAAVVVGVAGLVSWGLLVGWEGGVGQVYDQPHGGDALHPEGWVRETTRLALVGVVLALAASRARRASALALLFAAPQLVHAALGTRRGPAFVGAVLLVGGWYVFQGRRPRLWATLAGGAGLGLLILLLLANRYRVYYGSEAPITLDLTDSYAFYANTGNDYLVAAGLVVAADRTGTFGWGRSYVEQLFLRPIPRSVLPNKYDIIDEKTMTSEDIASTLGWEPPPGWSPTLFAHLYTEFSWLAVGVAALLGAAYGWTWRRAVESAALGWLMVQVLMMAGILHLFAQEVWAMAVPFLLTLAPTWLAMRLALGPIFGPRAPRPLPPSTEMWPAPESGAPASPARSDRGGRPKAVGGLGLSRSGGPPA